jgi:putative transposase
MNDKCRKSLRLRHYDYSQAGLYFITICTQGHKCLFGKIENGDLVLNNAGEQMNRCWLNIPDRFPTANLHQHIIMPNHFHGFIELVGASLVGARSPQTGQPQGIAPTVGSIVGAFKSISTNKYILGVKENGWRSFEKKLWQRNFYENVIRSEESFLQISGYIDSNPTKWHLDKYYSP